MGKRRLIQKLGGRVKGLIYTYTYTYTYIYIEGNGVRVESPTMQGLGFSAERGDRGIFFLRAIQGCRCFRVPHSRVLEIWVFIVCLLSTRNLKAERREYQLQLHSFLQHQKKPSGLIMCNSDNSSNNGNDNINMIMETKL